MNPSLFGLGIVTGGRRAISGPFIEYFCDISYSQGLLRPANGRTDSWTRNDRTANVLRRITCNMGLLQTQLKSNSVLLKETLLHKGMTRLTER